MRFLMVAFGDAAMVVGLADALDLTPAGRDLLARVEAAERTPRPMPAYLASFPQGPGAPVCEDCEGQGKVHDPAPDAPGARPPEPCVSCPGRTLPVTPAERFVATVLRAYLACDDDDDPRFASAQSEIEDVLFSMRLVNFGGILPAGAALLARVEAEERTPEDIARELVVKLQTSGAPSYVVSDAQVLLTSCVRLAALARLAATPPRKEP